MLGHHRGFQVGLILAEGEESVGHRQSSLHQILLAAALSLLHLVLDYSDYLNTNSYVNSIPANQNSLGCSLILHCLQTKNRLNVRNENDRKFKIVL